MLIPIVPTVALVGFAAVAARYGLRKQWQNAVICLLCGSTAFLVVHQFTNRPPVLDREPARIMAPPSSGAAVAPRIEPSQIDAAELAEYLDINGWSFRYSGRLARVWFEIEEGDHKIIVPNPPEDHPNLKQPPPKDQTGRINLWMRKGMATLRVSGAYPGGYSMAFTDDALWWGWRSWGSGTTRCEGLTPRAGEEVALLRHEVTESTAAAGNERRKVVVLLKAKFASDPK